MKRLLKGGIVVSPEGCRQLDVLMDEAAGIICRAEPQIDHLAAAAEVMDVTGKLLFPGFIDPHTHFDLDVSDTVTADDYITGTKAALSGGTTMVIDFATQNKGETLKEALANWHRKAGGKASCDYSFHMAISDLNEAVGAEMEDMMAAGITSFKLYMTYPAMVLDDKSIFRVLRRLKQIGGITGVHCENMGLIEALVEEEKAQGHLDPAAHPRTRPDLAEAEAVDRLLKLAKKAETPVIIVHLSSAAGLREVLHARAEDQEFYVETCPQYLLMEDSCYRAPGFEGAKYVCSPPIRKKADQEALWEALREGQIQTVGTDHCSFTMAQKEAGRNDFSRIPNGMPGVENRPVLMYTYGVKEHRISLEQMCALLSANPARLYGVYPQKGVIAPGSDADIVVWDPDKTWTISADNQQSACDYSPYEGTPVCGAAERVYLHGIPAAEEGKIINPLKGRFIKRGKYQIF